MSDPDISTLERALDIAIGDWDKDTHVSHFNSAGAEISRAAGRKKDYTGYYLRNIVRGKQPMTKRLEKACWYYLREEAETADEDSDDVTVPPYVNYVGGSMVLADSVLCWCGIWFVPRSGNQKYHTTQCRRKAYRERRKS